jgi:hypothetical protein
MKKTFLATLALALLLPASSALASGLSIYGSYWDTDALDDTAGAGVKFSIPLGQTLNLDLRGTYYEPFDRDALQDEIDDLFDDDNPDREIFDSEIEIIPLEVGLSFNLGQSSIQPSIGAGVSYFLLDSDLGEIDDEVGWYANAALNFASQGSVGFFLEGIYRSAEGEVNEDEDDVDFDRVTFDLDGFAANAGVVFRF